MERKVYKIENDYETNKLDEILPNLKITETIPIHDNLSNDKLIINKLYVLNDNIQSKLFIETSYLEVLSIDNNKLHLKLPSSHINFFNQIDDKCTELLGDLVNGDLDSELYSFIELINGYNIENFDLYNIEYKSLISTINSNSININIFSGTTIKQGIKEIDKTKINVGDTVRLVIGLDYISLLVDVSNFVARTKIYCYFIDVNKKYNYTHQSREKINDWNFSSNSNSNVFIKTNITNDDNFNVNTEVFVNNDINNKQIKTVNNVDVTKKILNSSEKIKINDTNIFNNSVVIEEETIFDSDHNSEFDFNYNSDHEPKPESESEPKPEPKPESKSESEPEPKPESKSESEPEPKPEPESEPNSNYKIGYSSQNLKKNDNISDSENIKLLSSVIINNDDNNYYNKFNDEEEKSVQLEKENLNQKQQKIQKTPKKIKITKTDKIDKTTKTTQNKKNPSIKKLTSKKSIDKKNINVDFNNDNDKEIKNDNKNNSIIENEQLVEKINVELENKVKSIQNKKSQVKQKTNKSEKKQV
jgi:hypothetical protein